MLTPKAISYFGNLPLTLKFRLSVWTTRRTVLGRHCLYTAPSWNYTAEVVFSMFPTRFLYDPINCTVIVDVYNVLLFPLTGFLFIYLFFFLQLKCYNFYNFTVISWYGFIHNVIVINYFLLTVFSAYAYNCSSLLR